MHQQGAVKDKAQMDATFIDGTGYFIKVLLALVKIKRDKNTPVFTRGRGNRVFYHRELLKGELKALCVVGDPFRRDVLHSVLQ